MDCGDTSGREANSAFRRAGVDGMGPADRWLVTIRLDTLGADFVELAADAVAGKGAEIRSDNADCGIAVVGNRIVNWRIGLKEGRRTMLIGLPSDGFRIGSGKCRSGG